MLRFKPVGPDLAEEFLQQVSPVESVFGCEQFIRNHPRFSAKIHHIHDSYGGKKSLDTDHVPDLAVCLARSWLSVYSGYGVPSSVPDILGRGPSKVPDNNGGEA